MEIIEQKVKIFVTRPTRCVFILFYSILTVTNVLFVCALMSLAS